MRFIIFENFRANWTGPRRFRKIEHPQREREATVIPQYPRKQDDRSSSRAQNSVQVQWTWKRRSFYPTHFYNRRLVWRTIGTRDWRKLLIYFDCRYEFRIIFPMALYVASSSSPSTSVSSSAFPFSTSSSELSGKCNFILSYFNFPEFSSSVYFVQQIFCTFSSRILFFPSVFFSIERRFFSCMLCCSDNDDDDVFQLHKSVRFGYRIGTGFMFYPKAWIFLEEIARSSRSTPSLNETIRLSLSRQLSLPLVRLCPVIDYFRIEVILMMIWMEMPHSIDCVELIFELCRICRSGGESRGGGLWSIG